MKKQIQVGKTSKRLFIFIQDSSKTDGSGLTGLVFGTSGLKWYYCREDDGNAGGTSITLATATLGTWTTGGFKEKDATHLPGVYEIGVPNAVLVAGSTTAIMMLYGATNMAPVAIEIQLTGYDPDDGIHLGLTSLPNAAAQASGGLFTIGTGSGQINQPANGQIDVNLKAANGIGVTLDTNNVLNVSVKYIGGTLQTARDIGTSVLVAGDLTSTMKTSVITAVNTSLNTAQSEVYAADGAAASLVQLGYETRQNITEFVISGTTKTVKKADGSTTAATYTLNDATTPTGITRAS